MRLVELRGDRTQEEVARELNIAGSTLSMYERGERIPRDTIKIRIAKYYNKPIYDIFLLKQLMKCERGANILEKKVQRIMNFDYSKLIARIYEIFKMQLAFAIQMGWTQRKCALKLNNSVQWFQYEIDKACKLLQIDDSEINSYFFKRIE